MTATRLLARPLLSTVFVVGGVNALKNADRLAEKATPVANRVVSLAKRAAPTAPIPTQPQSLVRLNAATQILAAAALATGRAPRISSTVLGATLIPTTLAAHDFWNETDPARRANHKIHFAKNLGLLGGLMLAAVDTDGKPGLAWRARRAAKDVRREARQLAHDASLETRLAVEKVK